MHSSKSISIPVDAENARYVSPTFTLRGKVQDCLQLSKFRLTSLVVFSAAMGFVIATRGNFSVAQLLWLIAGGLLVTAAANAFNQIIERDLDKLMDRTCNRPLPSGRMAISEAFVAAMLMAIGGVAILWNFMNPLCGLLSAVSLLIYVLIYTPSKRITPFSVFVGAIPGAFPPLLGFVAAHQAITFEALMLYAIQFIWQFPHFWAIAWVLEDDYRKAGFKMLPSPGGRDRSSAFQTMAYTLCLIPLALLPNFFGMMSLTATMIVIAAGALFSYQSFRLYKQLDIKSAQRLMFGSFIYLPVVQLAMMVDALMR